MRYEISEASNLGKLIKDTIVRGELVSDGITNDLVFEALRKSQKSFILDGYPRSLDQAIFLQKVIQYLSIELSVVHITLREDIIIRKLMGRRLCRTCGGNFNIEDVMEEGYDMPAIPPIPSSCKFGESGCNPVLVSRDDDTKLAIEKRLSDYRQNIGPLLNLYGNLNVLKEFEVKKGVKDTDALLKLMEQ